MKAESPRQEETGSQRVIQPQNEGQTGLGRYGVLDDQKGSAPNKNDQMALEIVLKNELRQQGALLGILTALYKTQQTLTDLVATSSTGLPQKSNLKQELQNVGSLLDEMNSLHEQTIELVPGELQKSE